MFQAPAKETYYEFPATLQSLERMREVAREALSATRLSEKDVTQVCLALEEAASNIIRHAYSGGEGEISLKFVTYRRRVIISLIDHGRPYFPDSQNTVTLTRLVETSRRGGLGQMMIDRLMDDVQYFVGDDYNELRMTKILPRRFAARSPLKGRAFSLRTRFSLATGGIMLAIIAGSYYFMETRIVSGISERVRENIRSLAGSTASLAAGYVLNDRTFVEFDELAVSAASQSEDIRRVTIIDSTGTILADSKDIANIHSFYAPPEGVDVPDTRAELWAELEDGRYLLEPIVSQGRHLGSVAVEYSDESFAGEIHRARMATLLVIGIETLIGILGIFLLSSYFVKPILNITEQVRRFGEGEDIAEAPVEGAAEFFEISRALNQMMTRLRRESVRNAERERLEKEVEIAGEIQKTLLPSALPEIPGLDVDSFYRSASEVGGDLFDVFALDERRYCLVVADVSGKGVPASLVMSVLRTTLRLTAPGLVSPVRILEQVERRMTQDIPVGLFITVGLAVYDISTRVLKYVSAGHNPMILCPASTDITRSLNPRGAPIGLGGLVDGEGSGGRYEEVSVTLGPGDTLAMYTDGVCELANAKGEQLGAPGVADRLQMFASRGLRGSAGGVISSIIESLDEYRDGAEQSDDMTILLGRATACVSDGAKIHHG